MKLVTLIIILSAQAAFGNPAKFMCDAGHSCVLLCKGGACPSPCESIEENSSSRLDIEDYVHYTYEMGMESVVYGALDYNYTNPFVEVSGVNTDPDPRTWVGGRAWLKPGVKMCRMTSRPVQSFKSAKSCNASKGIRSQCKAAHDL